MRMTTEKRGQLDVRPLDGNPPTESSFRCLQMQVHRNLYNKNLRDGKRAFPPKTAKRLRYGKITRHFQSTISRQRPPNLQCPPKMLFSPQALEAMPQHEQEGEREGEDMCHSEQGTPRVQTLDRGLVCPRDAQKPAHLSQSLRRGFFQAPDQRRYIDSLPVTWLHGQSRTWGPLKGAEQ